MRTLLMVLAFGLSAGPASPATQVATAPLPHVRPLDPLAAELVRTGSNTSQTFARLLATIDHGGAVVVYVTTSGPVDGRGSIAFVTRAGGITYLLVRVNSRQSIPDRVAVLAHELTHAAEISAVDPPISSERELARLYACIGIDSSGRHLESEAALQAERAVHHEIAKAATPDPAQR